MVPEFPAGSGSRKFEVGVAHTWPLLTALLVSSKHEGSANSTPRANPIPRIGVMGRRAEDNARIWGERQGESPGSG